MDTAVYDPTLVYDPTVHVVLLLVNLRSINFPKVSCERALVSTAPFLSNTLSMVRLGEYLSTSFQCLGLMYGLHRPSTSGTVC